VRLMRNAHKREDLCYAMTDEGLELAVVDLTIPAFACNPGEAELAAIADATFRGFERWARTPSLVRWFLARRSLTHRLLAAARGSFVSGTATYLFKLGPGNLPPSATSIDRHLNAALSPVCVRLRLQAMARQLAAALAAPLATRCGPLCLLNIGGGTGIDSLNALLLLHREHGDLLAGRTTTILVLDCDDAGPRFGARLLDALLADSGPLHGLAATFSHVPYNWSDVSTLQQVLAGLDPGAVVGCSSEGGLFEYGRDVDITANLRVLCDCGPGDVAVVGSLLKDGPTPTRMKESARMPLWRQFTRDEFARVIVPAGWTIARESEGNPLYDVFTLAQHPPRPWLSGSQLASRAGSPSGSPDSRHLISLWITTPSCRPFSPSSALSSPTTTRCSVTPSDSCWRPKAGCRWSRKRATAAKLFAAWKSSIRMCFCSIWRCPARPALTRFATCMPPTTACAP
jgi:hypothetical protein